MGIGFRVFEGDAAVGFRSGCGTEDAIFMARRRIEIARAQRKGRIKLVALDWAKAFDSLNVISLLDTFRRFGEFLQMIEVMLNHRRFSVKECGCTSPG